MFELEFPGDFVRWVLTVAAWLIILVLLIRHYKRQESKPVIWKAVLALAVGIAAVPLHINMFGISAKLAVLPIGVGLIYMLIKNESWQRYRKFAWAGFWSNYVMLVVALLSGMLFSLVYPKGDLSIYLAHVDKAELVETHHSSPLARLSIDSLKTSMDKAVLQENYPALEWNTQSMQEGEALYQKEQFPFMLSGVQPRWGSGLDSAVFVERDGQGLLVITDSDYLYFRSGEPFVSFGGEGSE